MAEPVTTLYSSSDDGETWQPFKEVDQPGWLYWRPKTLDNKTWYVTAYWHEHGKSVLLKSQDGETWTKVSMIHEGDHNDDGAHLAASDGEAGTREGRCERIMRAGDK